MQKLARRLQALASYPRVRHRDEESNREVFTFGQALPL